MAERVIPLTPPGPNWSQREYVACVEKGIGFAAHGARNNLAQWFHYGFPSDIGCTSVLIAGDRVLKYVDHPMLRVDDWINKCRIACTGRDA